MVASWNMLQFSFRSRFSTDSFNIINVSIRHFNFVNFQIKQLREFSLANLGCNYELNLNNLYENFRE